MRLPGSGSRSSKYLPKLFYDNSFLHTLDPHCCEISLSLSLNSLVKPHHYVFTEMSFQSATRGIYTAVLESEFEIDLKCYCKRAYLIGSCSKTPPMTMT